MAWPYGVDLYRLHVTVNRLEVLLARSAMIHSHTARLEDWSTSANIHMADSGWEGVGTVVLHVKSFIWFLFVEV